MKKTKIKKSKIILAALSGLLLTLSFPKTGIYWLAWFAIVPLLFALDNLSAKNSFYLGFCTGMIHYLTLVYWLAHTMRTYGHLPLFLCLVILCLLSAYLALYVAVFAWMVNRICVTPVRRLFGFPCIWVSLEYIRSFLFSGFPWELVGYSQFQVLPLIQIADVCGVYGVSFCVVLGNATLFLLGLYLKGPTRQTATVSKRLMAGSILTFAFVFGLLWFYGSWRIPAVDHVSSQSPSANIAIVQGNIDQAIKWDPAFQQASVVKYIQLSRQANTFKPDLVVWPETATPFYFLHNPKLSDMVITGIQDIGTDFLIGSPSLRSGKHQMEYFNSAFLMDSKGNLMGLYHKAHLVPFGEYIPFKRWLPFLGKLVEGVGDFQPGTKGQTLAWKNFRLGILICYEMIFPDLSRRMVKNQASLLLNITNDAWYGRSSAPYQHFSMAIFRAIENRRALVRSANTGISGFIDPVGRIIAATGLFETATLTHSVPLMDEKTLYARFGDVFAQVCLMATLAIALFQWRRHFTGRPF